LELFLPYRWSNYIRSSLTERRVDSSALLCLLQSHEKWGNKGVKILKFWRTELSYKQNKNRCERVRLLVIDTCPSLNKIIEIWCIKCTRSEKLYDFLNFRTFLPCGLLELYGVDTCKLVLHIRLHKYGHEQAKIRKNEMK
jgi:hypothetical protein